MGRVFCKMGHKDDSTLSPLMEEGSPQATLIDYVQARQRKRSLRDVTIVFSCFALLAWCGYLTLSVRDGVFEMKLAKIEMRKIEDVVNDVVAAMPSEKNKEYHLRPLDSDCKNTQPPT